MTQSYFVIYYNLILPGQKITMDSPILNNEKSKKMEFSLSKDEPSYLQINQIDGLGERGIERDPLDDFLLNSHRSPGGLQSLENTFDHKKFFGIPDKEKSQSQYSKGSPRMISPRLVGMPRDSQITVGYPIINDPFGFQREKSQIQKPGWGLQIPALSEEQLHQYQLYNRGQYDRKAVPIKASLPTDPQIMHPIQAQIPFGHDPFGAPTCECVDGYQCKYHFFKRKEEQQKNIQTAQVMPQRPKENDQFDPSFFKMQNALASDIPQQQVMTMVNQSMVPQPAMMPIAPKHQRPVLSNQAFTQEQIKQMQLEAARQSAKQKKALNQQKQQQYLAYKQPQQNVNFQLEQQPERQEHKFKPHQPYIDQMYPKFQPEAPPQAPESQIKVSQPLPDKAKEQQQQAILDQKLLYKKQQMIKLKQLEQSKIQRRPQASPEEEPEDPNQAEPPRKRQRKDEPEVKGERKLITIDVNAQGQVQAQVQQQPRQIREPPMRPQSPNLDTQIAQFLSIAPSQVSSIQDIYAHDEYSPNSRKANLGRKTKVDTIKKIDEFSQSNTNNLAEDYKIRTNRSVHPLNSTRGMKVQISLKNQNQAEPPHEIAHSEKPQNSKVVINIKDSHQEAPQIKKMLTIPIAKQSPPPSSVKNQQTPQTVKLGQMQGIQVPPQQLFAQRSNSNLQMNFGQKDFTSKAYPQFKDTMSYQNMGLHPQMYRDISNASYLAAQVPPQALGPQIRERSMMAQTQKFPPAQQPPAPPQSDQSKARNNPPHQQSFKNQSLLLNSQKLNFDMRSMSNQPSTFQVPSEYPQMQPMSHMGMHQKPMSKMSGLGRITRDPTNPESSNPQNIQIENMNQIQLHMNDLVFNININDLPNDKKAESLQNMTMDQKQAFLRHITASGPADSNLQLLLDKADPSSFHKIGQSKDIPKTHPINNDQNYKMESKIKIQQQHQKQQIEAVPQGVSSPQVQSDHNFSTEAQISSQINKKFPDLGILQSWSTFRDITDCNHEKMAKMPEASPPKNSDSDQKRLMEAIANSQIRPKQPPVEKEPVEPPKRSVTVDKGDHKMILKFKNDVKPPHIVPEPHPQTRISGLNPSSMYSNDRLMLPSNYYQGPSQEFLDTLKKHQQHQNMPQLGPRIDLSKPQMVEPLILNIPQRSADPQAQAQSVQKRRREEPPKEQRPEMHKRAQVKIDFRVPPTAPPPPPQVPQIQEKAEPVAKKIPQQEVHQTFSNYKGVTVDQLSNYAFETSSCKDYRLECKSELGNDFESSIDKRIVQEQMKKAAQQQPQNEGQKPVISKRMVVIPNAEEKVVNPDQGGKQRCMLSINLKGINGTEKSSIASPAVQVDQVRPPAPIPPTMIAPPTQLQLDPKLQALKAAAAPKPNSEFEIQMFKVQTEKAQLKEPEPVQVQIEQLADKIPDEIKPKRRGRAKKDPSEAPVGEKKRGRKSKKDLAAELGQEEKKTPRRRGPNKKQAEPEKLQQIIPTAESEIQQDDGSSIHLGKRQSTSPLLEEMKEEQETLKRIKLAEEPADEMAMLQEYQNALNKKIRPVRSASIKAPMMTANSEVINTDMSGHTGPYTLVNCEPYPSFHQQPYRIYFTFEVKLIMLIHSYLSKNEVIGLLGGKFYNSSTTIKGSQEPVKYLIVSKIYPSESCIANPSVRLKNCEMSDQEQIRVQEQMDRDGVQKLGWYHSHPIFDVDPSIQDLKTHISQQINFERQGLPFFGVIIGPYSQKQGPHLTQVNVFHLKEDKNSKGQQRLSKTYIDRGRQMHFKVIPSKKLKHSTYEAIKEMIKNAAVHQHDKPDMTQEWSRKHKYNYQQKFIYSIKNLCEINLVEFGSFDVDEIRRNLPKPEDRQYLETQLTQSDQLMASEQHTTYDLNTQSVSQQTSKQFSISDDKKINKFMFKIEQTLGKHFGVSTHHIKFEAGKP